MDLLDFLEDLPDHHINEILLKISFNHHEKLMLISSISNEKYNNSVFMRKYLIGSIRGKEIPSHLTRRIGNIGSIPQRRPPFWSGPYSGPPPTTWSGPYSGPPPTILPF